MSRRVPEGRYKSIAILVEASLLAMRTYIDLNPVAAGLAPTPEASSHTPIKARIDHCAAQGKLETLKAGSRYAAKVNVEKGHWLFPIKDSRDQNGHGLTRLMRGVSLAGYLHLVDWSSRLIRPGKRICPQPFRISSPARKSTPIAGKKHYNDCSVPTRRSAATSGAGIA